MAPSPSDFICSSTHRPPACSCLLPQPHKTFILLHTYASIASTPGLGGLPLLNVNNSRLLSQPRKTFILLRMHRLNAEPRLTSALKRQQQPAYLSPNLVAQGARSCITPIRWGSALGSEPWISRPCDAPTHFRIHMSNLSSFLVVSHRLRLFHFL